MELFEAIELIRFEPAAKKAQTWADLGCGSGLFTKALASLLPQGSLIHAIDTNEKAIAEVPSSYNGVDIQTTIADFGIWRQVRDIDGLMMCNSLHYIADKERFIHTKFEDLQAGGRFVLVEYELQKANQWVPFPITIKEAQGIFSSAGFVSFQVLGQRPSVYGGHNMYAAIAKK